jgi:hypothetical protein
MGARIERGEKKQQVAQCWGNLLSSKMELRCCFLDGLATAPAPGRFLGGRLAYEFSGPDRRDKFFQSMVIKIDGCAFGVGLRNGAHAVLLVPNCLTLNQNLHIASFVFIKTTRRAHLDRSKDTPAASDGEQPFRPSRPKSELSLPNGAEANPLEPIPDKLKPRAANRLDCGYALGLQTLRPLLHFEFDRLAFIEALVALGLDRRKVDEYILARLPLDESVSLRSVKPLYRTLFSAHFVMLLNYSYGAT